MAAAPYRVLVVEDEDLISMLTEDMLGNLGYEVGSAVATLKDGVKAAADGNFDIAVLDINLRGEKSYPIADILIERGIPFVFTSGYAAKGVDQRYSKTPTLQKPFTQESLKSVLSLSLGRRCSVS